MDSHRAQKALSSRGSKGYSALKSRTQEWSFTMCAGIVQYHGEAHGRYNVAIWRLSNASTN